MSSPETLRQQGVPQRGPTIKALGLSLPNKFVTQHLASLGRSTVQHTTAALSQFFIELCDGKVCEI